MNDWMYCFNVLILEWTKLLNVDPWLCHSHHIYSSVCKVASINITQIKLFWQWNTNSDFSSTLVRLKLLSTWITIQQVVVEGVVHVSDFILQQRTEKDWKWTYCMLPVTSDTLSTVFCFLLFRNKGTKCRWLSKTTKWRELIFYCANIHIS